MKTHLPFWLIVCAMLLTSSLKPLNGNPFTPERIKDHFLKEVQQSKQHGHLKNLLSAYSEGKSAKDYPSIDPYYQYFELNNPQDVVFTLDMGSETTITGIFAEFYTFDPSKNEVELVAGTDYTLSNDLLTIKSQFILSFDPPPFSSIDFRILFGPNAELWFDIYLIPSVDPFLAPSELVYDLSNPGDLVTSVASVLFPTQVSGVSFDQTDLVEGVDYLLDEAWLFITQSFLGDNLTTVDDKLELTVAFITGESAQLVITTIETGITNATISPTAATYINEEPDYQDITITWNDASQVEKLVVFVNSQWETFEFEWPHFVVTDNGDQTANLRILFGNKSDDMLRLFANKDQEIDNILITIHFDTGGPALFFLRFVYDYYDVTATAEPEDAGFVMGAWSYSPGEEVILQAYSYTGYMFSEWQDTDGHTLSSNNPYTFSMPAADVHLVAIFKAHDGETFKVVYGVDGQGGDIMALADNFYNVASGDLVEKGRSIMFMAYPWHGHRVSQWTLNGVEVKDHMDDLLFYPDLQQDISVMVTFETFTPASIEPDEQFFGLQNPEDVEFTIIWGDETEIVDIFRFDWDDDGDIQQIALVAGTDYIIDGNSLIIRESYILSLDPQPYDWISFMAEFDSGDYSYFEIQVIFSSDAFLAPSEAVFDLSSPRDVFTAVSYVQPYELVSISRNGNTLTENTHYILKGPWIVFPAQYLNSLSLSPGEEVEIIVHVDTGDNLPFVIHVLQSGLSWATIDPGSVVFLNDLPDYQDIIVTWNDAAEVTDLIVYVFNDYEMMFFPWPFYQITNINGTTANLRIFFDEAKSNTKMIEYTTHVATVINFDKGGPAAFFMDITLQLFNMIVTVTPPGSGWIYGDYTYMEGETVEVEAQPMEGFTFLHWKDTNGVVISTDNPYLFHMPGNDFELIAVFIPETADRYTLTLAVNPTAGGTVSGEGSFIGGASVTIVATANPGFEFVNWTHDGGTVLSTNSSFTFTMPAANIAYTANFEATGHTVTFLVTYNSAPVANANVSFNAQDKLTDSNGNAVFTDVADGTHNYSVSHTDFITVQSSIAVAGQDVTIPVALVSTTTIETATSGLILYPNPFGHRLFLETGTAMQRVVITNITGQVVYDNEINTRTHQMATHTFHSGVYFINILLDDGNRVYRKIIKQ